MKTIAVFQSEKRDRLSDKIISSGRISFASELLVAKKPETQKELSLSCLTNLAVADKAKAESGDFDLHYLKTILVSTGWNKNDDVFDRQEVWDGRHTPEDKPFNYEHNCSDIIGHITSNYVVDEQEKVVADDTKTEELPAKYHVVTGAVLYKYWEKAELQKRMDEILKEIPENKWFVSMECLFSGFDYAVKSSDGTSRVIARNEQTAFLTKHLRIYGGEGVYDGMKVGRLLRNITFSGKGLVRRPANPESVILSQATEFNPKDKILCEISRSFSEMGYSQAAQIKHEAQMEKEIQDLQKQMATLKTENEKLQKELQDTNVKKIQAALDESVVSLKEANAKIEAEAKAHSETKVATEKLSKELDETKASSKKVADELQAIKDKVKAEARIASVKLALKMEDAEAKAFAESLSELSDDKFEANVKAVAKLAPKAPETPVAKKPEEKAPEKDKAGEKAAASTNLDTIKVTPEVSGAATESLTKEVEQVRKSIAAYMGCEDETQE